MNIPTPTPLLAAQLDDLSETDFAGTALTALMAEIRSLSTTEKKVGDYFELLAKWWLENDPVYKAKFVKVWHFKKWDQRWTNKDLGTDLIAEDDEGKFWAIQAKGYKLGAAFEDMGTWLADSNRPIISYRLLITSTHAPGPHANATTVFAGQVDKPVFVVDRHGLEHSDVTWPESITDLYAPQPEPKTARDYQTDAINAVTDGFTKADRGQLLMVSATGKTLTGMFIHEKIGSKTTLVLVPSLLLLKQTLKVWRANNTVPFKSLPVGSDPTANRFGIGVPVSLMGYPTTTNAVEIADFLREDGVKVVFSTYQSSREIEAAQAMADVPDFDLVIADEAHNTAGALNSYFATVLHNEKIKATRRLFMTATPRNFTPRVLQRAVEVGDERASMDDEKRYGEVFYELPYVQALERKLVTDYRIAIIAVTEAEILDWAESGHHVKINGVDDDLYKLAGQIAVLKAMGKYGMRRVITFHNRVQRASGFAKTLPQALDWLPEDERPSGVLWAKHIHGDMSVDDRTLLLDQLGGPAEDQFKVLANARVLTEGVDVPALDGIAILDPKRSAIAIYQAQGRAIRLDHSKPHPADEITYTVLPVFVPAGEDVDDEAILNSSAFEPVWRELLAMRMFDERFAEWVDGFRLEKGKPGPSWRPTLPPMVETNLYEAFGEDFANAFVVKLVEMTTSSFEEYFGATEQYIKEHGNALVPKKYETVNGLKLGDFVSNQRVLKIMGKLSPERADRLGNLLGWEWDVPEAWWKENYFLYRDYRAEKGILAVDRTVFRTVPIGKWAAKQRIAKRKGKLSAEKIDLLEAIDGWEWEAKDAAWQAGLLHAREVKDPAHVKQSYKSDDEYPTGAWIFAQRTRKRQGKLSAERIKLLEAIDGWEWERLTMTRWLTIHALYRDWSAENGHQLPRTLKLGSYNVGQWVNNQRAFYRRNKLSAEKIDLLKGIDGWEWEPKAKTFYTPEEDEIILQSTSLKELHRLLPNRSPDALNLRRSVLRAQHGLSAKVRPYSPEEDKIVRQEGVSLDELSRQLGRTVGSIRNRRYVLRGKRRR